MKSTVALATALFATLVAAPAFADDAPSAAPDAAAPAPDAAPPVTVATAPDAPDAPAAPELNTEAAAAAPSNSIAAQLELLPIGSLALKSGSIDQSVDTATAFAITGIFAINATPNLSLGVAPRLILGVKGGDGTDSATEIDLRARATVHTEVAPKIQLLGFVEPGYSILAMPSDYTGDSPKGFVLGLGAGVSYDVTPTAFVTGELGYQLGFQGVSMNGVDTTISTSYLHLGLGAGSRF